MKGNYGKMNEYKDILENNALTKQEKIEKIKEIRRVLGAEVDKLERELKEAKDKEIIEAHQACIGKCFQLKKFVKSESEPNVYAFKILSLVECGSQPIYARCLALVNGVNNTIWSEIGVVNKVMSLWGQDSRRMMHEEDAVKTIDLYREITEDNFEYLKKDCLSRSEIYVGE